MIAVFSFCALLSGAQNFNPTYLQLVDSADMQIKKENWAVAETYIIKALQSDPANKSNYLLWANLGMVRANRNEHPAALEAFDIGLASAPNSTSLLTARAMSLLAVGQPGEALKDLDKALRTDSTLRKPLKLHGVVQAGLRKYDGAIKDFDRYEAIFGDDADIQSARGDIATSRQQPEEALRHYKKTFELAGDEESLEKFLRAAYLFGHLEDEEETLRSALITFPRNGNLYLLRAALNRARYQTQAMESDLKMARDLKADKTLTELITSKENQTKPAK
ncbi:MAG: tetratricopeptide repeat protein [Muribaculaceae bacterium]|nr:tetratricopeptide repeat protein [Muribaculaceae bacterium]